VRLLRADVDASGRSYLAEQGEVTFEPVSGVVGTAVGRIFSIDQNPPPPCQPGTSLYTDKRLGPGHFAQYIIDHAPWSTGEEREWKLHYGHAIDVVTILQGGGEMLLGDGAHALGAGDCIIMPGVDHVFRPGPLGCRMMAFAIGTPGP
jgi:mannose-6-phosphate isomerase-like protein (cupin superfamily)